MTLPPCKTPELQAIIDEHGLLTGQEFLDLTYKNMDLYHQYLDYFDNDILPRVVANIKTRGSVEDARTLDKHTRSK
jgi:hypothetical protein